MEASTENKQSKENGEWGIMVACQLKTNKNKM
jgi:hypothetical protein